MRRLFTTRLLHRKPTIQVPQRAINESCARFFAAQLEAKPWIQQLRVISAQPPGMEVVRVDRSGVDNAVRIVPPEELQSKGSRDYFDAGVQLQDQEVYISKVELNAEKGAIEYPYQPVFRSVTPVIDESSGRAVAIVVINVRLEQVFDSLTSTLYPSSRVYIVDGNGDYLRHATNPDMEFAAAAGLQHHRWEEDFDTRRWTSGKYAQSTAVVTGPDEVRVGAVVAVSVGARRAGD